MYMDTDIHKVKARQGKIPLVKKKLLMHRGNINDKGKKKPDAWNSSEKITHYFHSYPIRFCCKVSCFSLSACLPNLWGIQWSWFECSGVTPHFVIPNETTSSSSHFRKAAIFTLISSWEISWRNQQGTLHYFEEDVTTWLFWNKNHSFEKKVSVK